jgi:hypothetical protein
VPRNKIDSLLEGRSPLEVINAYGDRRPYDVPDIMEFCLSDRYLNRASLYPRQATLLKCIFLQDELFTPYDYDVLGEWADGFRLHEADVDAMTTRFEGDWGISPDVLTRIKLLKTLGYRWFKIVLAVQGRRSGKGLIGAIAGAYVLWNYLCISDPKRHYGIDAEKRITSQVFAGKKAQARDNQWRDLSNIISTAPCFTRYFTRGISESTSVSVNYDIVRALEIKQRQLNLDVELSSFEIVPKEATTMAARGPASFMQFYDEGAHMVSTGVSRSMEEVWNSATPALGQFHQDAFIYSGSSPWTMDGKFFELVQEGLEVNNGTLEPVSPSTLIIQLASWDIYLDWERTVDGDMVAARARTHPALLVDGKEISRVVPTTFFPPLKNAVEVYDDEQRRIERLNPDTFKVEKRAKWAAALDTYLPLEHVRRVFNPWKGQYLEQKHSGSPVIAYFAHGDPGQTGSNFGFAVAHYEADPDGDKIGHVVFDLVKAWRPGDFPTMEMDYLAIGEEIGQYMDGFVFEDLSFDQWNSISLRQSLEVRATQQFKRGRVWQRDATNANNWATAETFKLALALGRVHAPYVELAELEMMFLRKLPGNKVDHPDTGPCTSKDVYDAMSIVVYKILGGEIASAYGAQFSALQAQGTIAGPTNFDPNAARTTDNTVLNAFSQLTREQSSRFTSSSPSRGRTKR